MVAITAPFSLEPDRTMKCCWGKRILPGGECRAWLSRHQSACYTRGLCSRPEWRLEIRAIRRPKGIHKIRGQGVCKSPKRQLESSVCMDGVVTENQDTNRAPLKSELVDLGSVSGWEYDQLRTDCRQWCRVGCLPCSDLLVQAAGQAQAKGRRRRWVNER